MEIWMRYELRAAPFGTPTRDLIPEVLSQIEWADKNGFHTVQLGEHHGFADGYNPSPLVFGGAVAARTKNVRINPTVVLPFYDPVRLAEDCCVLDNISQGRLDITTGTGYTLGDFEMMGVQRKDRGRLTERALKILTSAFAGENLDFEGRKGRVMPMPFQKNGPPIYVGGSVLETARRAAQYGSGYYPMDQDLKFINAYHGYCAEFGKPVGKILLYSPALTVHVAEDPDADWARIAPYALYEANEYGAAAAEAGSMNPFQSANTADELRKFGTHLVLSPDQCVAYCLEQQKAGRFVTLSPMMAGIPADLAWSSLELFAAKVMPRLGIVKSTIM